MGMCMHGHVYAWAQCACTLICIMWGQAARLRVEVEELLSAERQAEDLMTKEILGVAKDHPKLSRLLMAERVESATLRSDLEVAEESIKKVSEWESEWGWVSE